MGIFGRRPQTLRVSSPSRGVLTADGARVKKTDTETLRRLVQPWQLRSYGYYDTIPEIKFAAQFYSRMLSPLRLFAATNIGGEVEEIDDPKIVEQVERIQDPGGGRSSLLGSYGRQMFLGGESLLTVTTDKESGDEQWEMLSPLELRMGPDGNYLRLKAPQLAPEMLRDAPDDAFQPMGEGEAVVYRLYRRHPAYSLLPDSTMQAVLDVCEELVLLSRDIRSRTRQRITSAGILLVNGEVTSVTNSISGDADDANPDEDPFLRDLTDAAVAAIQDEASPSSVVPIIVRVDAGDDKGGLDNVMKHIQFVDPNALHLPGQRKEAIERLAIGLDMPPEVLTGLGGMNHWSGWMVDEQSWKQHGQPVAQQLVDDLTAAFFRPTLEKEEIPNWQDYVIGFDPAAVVSHPDQGKDAKDLHDRGAIGDQALRESNNFTDQDAPTEDERQVWLGIQLRDASVALTGELAPPPATAPNANQAIDPNTVDAGDTANEVKKTAPDPIPARLQPEGDVQASGNGNGNDAAKIIGACDLGLYRARELAGARLRTHANRDKEILKSLKGVSNRDVAATITREGARKIGAPPERDLVKGVGESISETLRLWRIDPELVGPLVDRIEQHAARTLFESKPSPLPPSFANYVRGLEAVAGH